MKSILKIYLLSILLITNQTYSQDYVIIDPDQNPILSNMLPAYILAKNLQQKRSILYTFAAVGIAKIINVIILDTMGIWAIEHGYQKNV